MDIKGNNNVYDYEDDGDRHPGVASMVGVLQTSHTLTISDTPRTA
jgi:hypothetical protein